MYYCSVLSLCPVFSFPFSVPRRTRERKIVNKYIYQSYNKDYYYNNNHYIMGTFPARVLCPGAGGVCPWGSRSLLKLSQVGRCWQAGKYWERYWGICFSENIGRFAAGAGRYLGRYTFVRITVFQRHGLCRYPGRRITHQYLTIHIENVIISVTMITKKLFVTRRAKMPLESVFPPIPIKSH